MNIVAILLTCYSLKTLIQQNRNPGGIGRYPMILALVLHVQIMKLDAVRIMHIKIDIICREKAAILGLI